MSIITPSNKTRLNTKEEISTQFKSGNTVLVEYWDEDVCYAAHCFSMKYGKESAVSMAFHMTDHKGIWYVLN